MTAYMDDNGELVTYHEAARKSRQQLKDDKKYPPFGRFGGILRSFRGDSAGPIGQQGEDMGYVRDMQDIGNGDFRTGANFVADLAARMRQARKKHKVFAIGQYNALGVISAEHRELVHAVEHETPERAKDEALDVITTSARFYNGEHEPKENA